MPKFTFGEICLYLGEILTKYIVIPNEELFLRKPARDFAVWLFFIYVNIFIWKLVNCILFKISKCMSQPDRME